MYYDVIKKGTNFCLTTAADDRCLGGEIMCQYVLWLREKDLNTVAVCFDWQQVCTLLRTPNQDGFYSRPLTYTISVWFH